MKDKEFKVDMGHKGKDDEDDDEEEQIEDTKTCLWYTVIAIAFLASWVVILHNFQPAIVCRSHEERRKTG